VRVRVDHAAVGISMRGKSGGAGTIVLPEARPP
jgi:hypothetical protein